MCSSDGAPSGHGQDSFKKRERTEEERYIREQVRTILQCCVGFKLTVRVRRGVCVIVFGAFEEGRAFFTSLVKVTASGG